MQGNRILIGTRGSHLALWQTNYVVSLLRDVFPSLIFEVRIIRTTGDQLQKQNPASLTSKGLFTKEIEEALLEGAIDIAIHSLKDLPTELPEGLTISAVLERAHPEDVLIAKNNTPFFSLANNAKIGTSSLRRASQLLHLRPDLRIAASFRGNVETRIRNLFASDYDAIVLAYAGLERIGYTHTITEVFPTEMILPAVGQGAIAIECLSQNSQAFEIAAILNHEETSLAVQAERSFLRSLGGGCQTPIAGYAYALNGEIILDGLVASPDGSHYFRSSLVGSKDSPDELGQLLAQTLIEQGAAKVLGL